MDIDARIQYYEAFVFVRDVLRTVEATCASLATSDRLPAAERALYQVEQLKWQCELVALEEKRRLFDANAEAVFAPCALELRAIGRLASEAQHCDLEAASMDDLGHVATEAIQFFKRLHP